MVIFRENTEDVYAGIEFESGSEEVKKLLAFLKESFPQMYRKVRFPGGESLDESALRYAAAFGRLLARDEPTTLVVCHEIPVRYIVNAAAASSELNGPLSFVANATPYLFDDASLQCAVDHIRELAS